MPHEHPACEPQSVAWPARGPEGGLMDPAAALSRAVLQRLGLQTPSQGLHHNRLPLPTGAPLAGVVLVAWAPLAPLGFCLSPGLCRTCALDLDPTQSMAPCTSFWARTRMGWALLGCSVRLCILWTTGSPIRVDHPHFLFVSRCRRPPPPQGLRWLK